MVFNGQAREIAWVAHSSIVSVAYQLVLKRSWRWRLTGVRAKGRAYRLLRLKEPEC